MEWQIVVWISLYLLVGLAVAEFVHRSGVVPIRRSATSYVIISVLWGLLLPISLAKLAYEALTGRSSDDTD